MRRFLRVDLPTMAWNKLIRRQLLLDNHIVFCPGMLHEDELWSYELFNIVGSVVLIPEVTYYYEKNADSVMNSPSNLIRRTEGYHMIVFRVLNTLCHDLYVDRFFWGIYIYMQSFLHKLFHQADYRTMQCPRKHDLLCSSHHRES